MLKKPTALLIALEISYLGLTLSAKFVSLAKENNKKIRPKILWYNESNYPIIF